MGTEVMERTQMDISFPGFETTDLAVYTANEELVDQERLVGIPFVVTDWIIRESSLNEAGYISVTVMLQDGSYKVFNNGATWEGSIRDVLALDYKTRGTKRGLVVLHGLRSAENPKGVHPIYAFA